MNILLISTDIYKDLAGGGQFVTRKIIECHPEHTFYYFIDKERLLNDKRPVNVKVFKLGLIIDIITENNLICNEDYIAIKTANRFARCVKNLTFDLVEFPDYTVFGKYLRYAFLHHNVKFSYLILSLHGNISKSMELNWDFEFNSNIVKLERDQFIDADITYGISTRYLNENISFFNRNVIYINPIYFLNKKNDYTSFESFYKSEVSIFFVGRLELRKGPDLFIDLVEQINKNLYKFIHIIGDDYFTKYGESAKEFLRNSAKDKCLDISFSASLSQKELFDIYSSNAILILPVRYDTFNLVALDAIFSGCPVAISKEAGICDFLDIEFPSIPYIKITDQITAVKEIEKVLKNYKEFKINLDLALKEIFIPQDFKSQFLEVYKKSHVNILEKDKIKNFSYSEKLPNPPYIEVKSLTEATKFIIEDNK